MRVSSLHIRRWRQFRDFKMEVPAEVKLVCLVGENGTGKTNLLDLVSAAADVAGITRQPTLPRGDPMQEDHDLSIEFIADQSDVDRCRLALPAARAVANRWTGRLLVESTGPGDGSPRVLLDGSRDPENVGAAKAISRFVCGRSQDVPEIADETFYLYLDADRYYTWEELRDERYMSAIRTDWVNSNWHRGAATNRVTSLYENWLMYMIGRHRKYATGLENHHRQALRSGDPPPEYEDIFAEYGRAIQTVLPHLRFDGVDEARRTVLFEVGGERLRFSSLSAGEREVAFLIGQFVRFNIKRGLLLLDEPEIHLNPALIRTFLGYVKAAVTTGQAWMATQSLEAAEVAGPSATFVLDRAANGRVGSPLRPAEHEVFGCLQRALGTPAFAVSKVKIVYVEGDDKTGERERFRRLCPDLDEVRFAPVGGHREVLRRVTAIRALAKELPQPIRIGGVIDADLRPDAVNQQVSESAGQLHVLGVHEIENLFLHPTSLQEVARVNGRDVGDAAALVAGAADCMAGRWVVDRALEQYSASRIVDLDRWDPAKPLRRAASNLEWAHFQADHLQVCQRLAKDAMQAKDGDELNAMTRFLASAVSEYRGHREQGTLWKVCFGKEVLDQVARSVGLADGGALEDAVCAAWTRNAALVPEDVNSLHKYVASLDADSSLTEAPPMRPPATSAVVEELSAEDAAMRR